eukprot:8211344-Alexandrium_andersonii.AAC.1
MCSHSNSGCNEAACHVSLPEHSRPQRGTRRETAATSTAALNNSLDDIEKGPKLQMDEQGGTR